MVNILSGGLHAGRNFEFQDFLAVPLGFATYAEALEAIVAVHRAARAVLEERGYATDRRGGRRRLGAAPACQRNRARRDARSHRARGLSSGRQMAIAIDVAASHFFDDGKYELQTEGRSLTSAEMIDLLAGLGGALSHRLDRRRPGRRRLGRMAAADRRRSAEGATDRRRSVRHQSRAAWSAASASTAANAVLVKMNQIGTLTETFQVIDRARAAGFRAVISARSGETEDDFLADLAVASGAGQIKVGSITRSERLAKYNRLLEIEAGREVDYLHTLPVGIHAWP